MKKFAVFGQNIDYSLSPRIHKMIYEHMGIEAEYDLLSVEPDAFAKTLPQLFALSGFNVTKPYKRRIADFVEVQGDWDAVNTVVERGGRYLGYNTDADGFEKHFLEIADPSDSNVLILGAGGVAEIAVPFFIKRGADVSVYNRTRSAAELLCAAHGGNVADDKGGRYQIVVNCTPFGLNAGENAAEGIDFSETIVAYDMLYFETEFLKTAQAAGVPFVENGLAMLIYQAIRADELFFDTKIEQQEKLYQKILTEIKL